MATVMALQRNVAMGKCWGQTNREKRAMGLARAGRGASWETAVFCMWTCWLLSLLFILLSHPVGAVVSICLFSLFIHQQIVFLDSFQPPSVKLESVKPKCVCHFPRTFHQSCGTLWRFNEINRWLHQASKWLTVSAAQLDHLAERWRPGDTVGRRGVAVEAFIWIPRKLLY